MVHGRFQPFHRGHLEYVREVAGRCRDLVVGITNPEPDLVPLEPASPHRHLAAANPYSFWERALMVRAALEEEGIEVRRLLIVPFPIHDPSRWHHYVPAGATHFIRVFSPWEAEKAERLRAVGHRVVELQMPVKEISGTEVRRRMEAGEDWRELVPPAVASLLAGRHGQA